MSQTRLARRRGFQCMHRYAVDEWSEEQNRAEFGVCFTPHGHGHNYELEVYLEGAIDSTTGMIVNLADVDQWLSRALEPLDGKHLNFDVPAFRAKVPTTEALAQHLTEQLKAQLEFPQVRLVKVRLYECSDLWVDVWL